MGGVRLYFTVNVTFQPVDRDNTDWDNRAREPVHQVAYAADVTLKAQVHVTSRNRIENSQAGTIFVTSGHLVILTDSLESAGYAPNIGDRIPAIPGETGVYYVTQVTPKAHKFGRNQTVHIGFESRTPARRN